MQKSVAISIADQGMLSLFNLALNAALIAFASPTEFGHYVFAAAVVLILTSLQNALVATPIGVVYPRTAENDRAEMRALLLGFDRVLTTVAALIAVPVCMLTQSDPLFLIAVSWLVAATLVRETWRNLALAENRPRDLIRIDAIAVAVAGGATVLLWQLTRPSVAALAGTALGSTLAVWLTARNQRSTGAASPSLLDLPCAYAAIWESTRWSLAGAATTEVQYRAYVFMLEAFRTTREIAEVQAGRLLLGPLPLLAGAWGRVARPELARRLAAGDRNGALRVTLWGLALILGVAAAFLALVFALWPWLELFIFRGRYPGAAEMTVAWSVYTVLMVSHVALSAPLMAALELEALSKVTLATAVLSLVLLLGLALPVPPIHAVSVGIVCELIALIWISGLVWRLFASPTAANSAMASAVEVQRRQSEVS